MAKRKGKDQNVTGRIPAQGSWSRHRSDPKDAILGLSAQTTRPLLVPMFRQGSYSVAYFPAYVSGLHG
ncbi:uncharacterized protein FRV6_11733 [Fusarium oxysporum]|uniref:Uncharacterized protein n=1 Tax=Fusarium oxysporum TaxID=5507 RepID=A0A2H3TWB0_FUSOX|nr:uncharacterized protein FRV6_11733 [Fusarium oxysporum]